MKHLQFSLTVFLDKTVHLMCLCLPLTQSGFPPIITARQKNFHTYLFMIPAIWTETFFCCLFVSESLCGWFHHIYLSIIFHALCSTSLNQTRSMSALTWLLIFSCGKLLFFFFSTILINLQINHLIN